MPEPLVDLREQVIEEYSPPPVNQPEVIHSQSSQYAECNPTIQQAWDEIVSYIDNWYHEIDIDAIRIILSAAVAHRVKHEVPIWCFLLGASGTGKSLVPFLIEALPDVYKLNSITPNSLLSGLPRSKGGESLLLNIGSKEDRSGILLFPDFSTVISKRDDAVKSIAGDLREVYDGRLRKDTGASKAVTWEGKVTIIAFCTPELERQWGAMRGLGERFVQVRWGRGDGILQATKAYQQIGKEVEIKRELTRLAKNFFKHIRGMFPDPPDPISNGVAHLSEITSLLRASAIRDDRTKKLEDVSDPEGNTRFFKAIVQIARAHAAMFGRDFVDMADYKLAARVALDSIPAMRLRVVRAIPRGTDIFQQDLIDKVAKPKTSTLRIVEELEFLGVVNVDRSGGENYIEFTQKFEDMQQRAGLLWH